LAKVADERWTACVAQRNNTSMDRTESGAYDAPATEALPLLRASSGQKKKTRAWPTHTRQPPSSEQTQATAAICESQVHKIQTPYGSAEAADGLSAGAQQGCPGWPLVLSGVFLHLMPYFVLLGSYCSETGCFSSHADGAYYIPSFSDCELTHIDGRLEASFPSHGRRVFALLAAYARSLLDAYILCQSYRALVNVGRLHPFPCTVFEASVVLHSFLGSASASIPNATPTKLLHGIVSGALMFVLILTVIPQFACALGSEPGMNQRGLALLWAIDISGGVLGFYWAASWLGFLGFIDRSWHWFAIEWVLLALESSAFIVMGFLIPRRLCSTQAAPKREDV